MNLELYTSFNKFLSRGLKPDAREAIVAFVASFESVEEKRRWVEAELQHLSENTVGRIRHELYEGVIFPVLEAGYHARDPWCLYWLARTAQNFYRTPMHGRIDEAFEEDLLMQVYEADPDFVGIRTNLLGGMISDLDFAIHEWPDGIWSGMHGASLEACEGLQVKVTFARALDQTALHEEFLTDFEGKLRLYMKGIGS